MPPKAKAKGKAKGDEVPKLDVPPPPPSAMALPLPQAPAGVRLGFPRGLLHRVTENSPHLRMRMCPAVACLFPPVASPGSHTVCHHRIAYRSVDCGWLCVLHELVAALAPWHLGTRLWSLCLLGRDPLPGHSGSMRRAANL